MRELVELYILPAALSLLPPRMDSPQARRMLLAIAAQESGFRHRVQVGGPARGLLQFELTGLRGVLEHPASAPHAKTALKALLYGGATPDAIHHALAHNDVLACVMARLLLWTDPHPLPDDEAGAWALYLRTWRPGRPRVEAWAKNWEDAEGG